MPKVPVSQSLVLPLTLLVAQFLVISVVIPQPLAAQQAAGTKQPCLSSQKTDASQQPTETLKVNVNVVQLFFNVKDKHGALIPKLTKDDFEVYEDGKPQTLK